MYVVPPMPEEPPPDFVTFVAVHIGTLRSEAARLTGGSQRADEVYPVVLSDVAAFVFEQLKRPVSREDLLALVLAEFEVDESTASADLDALLAQFREMELLEE